MKKIGYELEAEGSYIDEYESSSYLSFHTEPSLRGRHTEFVLTTPTPLSDIQPSLDELSQRLSDNEFYITNRCSFHVHIDVRELSRVQLYNACIAYSLFERVLYQISGSRERSKYCVPLSKSTPYKRAVASIKSSSHPPVDEYMRYAGLNLHAVNKFGSLEFRMHEGSLDVEELSSWIHTCHDLVDKGSLISSRELISRSGDFTSFLELAVEIFGADSSVVDKLKTHRTTWISYDTKVAEQIELLSAVGGQDICVD